MLLAQQYFALGKLMTLRIIATGGTFDKHYDEIAGNLCFATGHVSQAVSRARILPLPTIEELPFLDSLDMQMPDRQLIFEACKMSIETHIVIIHGTDTMAETAAVLGLNCFDKTVVLTGAMIPYEITGSDALFNLGFACCAAKILSPGVYIAMNGTVFPWDNVCKDRCKGVFSTIT